MDTISIIFYILVGICCGGLVAAGFIMSRIMKSNVYGEEETEKDFLKKHDVAYHEMERGHKILFF